MPDEMRASHESAAPFPFCDSVEVLRARPSGPRVEAIGSPGSVRGSEMPSIFRLLFAATVSLFLAVPAGAVQPSGSAGWTTDGWVSLSGDLRAGPGAAVRSHRQHHRRRPRPCRSLRHQALVPDPHRVGTRLVVARQSEFRPAAGWPSRRPEIPHRARRSRARSASSRAKALPAKCFCAKSGRVIPDLALLGRDNEISSVEVGTGVSAIVCRDRGFRSYCEVVDVSKGRIDGLLNNGISSIRVY